LCALIHFGTYILRIVHSDIVALVMNAYLYFGEHRLWSCDVIVHWQFVWNATIFQKYP